MPFPPQKIVKQQITIILPPKKTSAGSGSEPLYHLGAHAPAKPACVGGVTHKRVDPVRHKHVIAALVVLHDVVEAFSCGKEPMML